MKNLNKSAKDVFDQWAQDYHADGMEKGHWKSVMEAFQFISESQGNYLEIGFGNGYGIYHMATNQYKTGQCYGLDISPMMTEKAKNKVADLHNVHLQAGDFLKWTPPLNFKFSCIFSMEVFYYFENIRTGIEKARNLLTPNGQLLVLVNRYLENEESHSWDKELNTPMTLWSAEQYYNEFLYAGFKEVKQQYLNQKDDHPGTLCTTGINP